VSDFKEVLETAQILAIANKLSPNEESIYRSICREYSKRFNVPLTQVIELPIEKLLLDYYEDQMDEVDVDEHIGKLMETIYTIEDPSYVVENEKDLEEFIKESEDEEKERLDQGIGLTTFLKSKQKKTSEKTLLEKAVSKAKQETMKNSMPKEGGINLSHLEALDSGESGEF
jgi:hypothetical protein